jgi:hypothetical protein
VDPNYTTSLIRIGNNEVYLIKLQMVVKMTALLSASQTVSI